MVRKYGTQFGDTVRSTLTASGTTQTDLANQLGTSTSYLNHTLTGRKPVSPTWADLVADVLNLPDSERQRLHEAAAKDQGFKLDLTKK